MIPLHFVRSGLRCQGREVRNRFVGSNAFASSRFLSSVVLPSEVEFSVTEPRQGCPLQEQHEKQASNSTKTDDLVLGGKLAIPNPYARGGGGCNICGRESHESCDFCDDETKVSAFIKEIKQPGFDDKNFP